MTSTPVEIEPEYVIRERINDYITCEAHLPPIMRWHKAPVCGAMVPTKDQQVPIMCPACGSRVL